MKIFLFLLISIFVTTAYSEAEEKDSIKVDTSQTLKKDSEKKLELDTSSTFKKDGEKKLEFDATTTLKKDGEKKLEFDSDSTFKNVNTQSTADMVKKIKETIQKDPKEAELLTAKIKELKKLLSEAKKYKDFDTEKNCAKAVNSLNTLANFHNGKNVLDKKLYEAYNDSRTIDKDIQKFKLRIESAKRNTPQAVKIRKFQFAAKNDLEAAEKAEKQGKKALAEYYRTCAKIKQNTADNYAKNPKIEETGKLQIKKAVVKYNHDYALETAGRFRERAKKYRDAEDEEKAKYYEKAAALKEKLAQAYTKDDRSLIKSLQKEYESLQNTRF